MKEYLKLFLGSVLAGICISIGCIVYLKTGGMVGAFLFTFGLITVVHYKYPLFTGTAGFIDIKSPDDMIDLFLYILHGNVFGCLLVVFALMVSNGMPELFESVKPIIEQRINQNVASVLVRGILCGFLMTTAVKFARENKWLPLLFAVPVFILSGFYHSIADAFYLSLGGGFVERTLFLKWWMTVIGNFFGCNLYRIVEAN